MTKIHTSISEIYYAEQLCTIKGIKLTKREIDIIACLVCGRAASIPKFLSISSRTVESHIRNITPKLGCNSRDGIINFVENSDKMFLIRNHYQNLLNYALFEKVLKEISILIKNDNSRFILSLNQNDDITHNFMRHLDVLKINSSHSIEKETHNIVSLVFINRSEYDSKSTYLCEQSTGLKLVNEDIHIQISRSFSDRPDASDSNIYSFQTYFDFIFKLLEINYPQYTFEKIISEFKEKCSPFYTEVTSLPKNSNTINIKEKESLMDFGKCCIALKNKISLLPKRTRVYIDITLFIFVIFTYYHMSIFIKNLPPKQNHSIVSDLQIPSDSVRLDRTNLIELIDKHLLDIPNIKERKNNVIGITGIAGSGKTTLSRIYGRINKKNLVWEINSETREALIDSFYVLAYALSNTQEKKAEVDSIKSIQDKEAREFKLSLFISDKLQKHTSWLLIFDNVSNINTLKHFYPRDVTKWGIGKIIITSRDSKIMQSEYIGDKKVIKVEQLSKEESTKLFCNILHNKDFELLTTEEKHSVLQFLDYIAPFPMDISLSAHYLKKVPISFEEYIKRKSQNDKNLGDNEMNIKKSGVDFSHSRSSLISNSIAKVIEKNHAFKNILYFISLLDPDDIPTNLLGIYKDPILVGELLLELEAYSLITKHICTQKNKETKFFSIHHTTQQYIRDFLNKEINVKDRTNLLQTYSNSLKINYEDSIVKKDHNSLYPQINHLKEILVNVENTNISSTIKNEISLNIMYVIANSYHHSTANYIEEKKYFELACQLQEKTKCLSDKDYALMLKYLSYVYIELGYMNEPIECAQKALILYENIPNSDLLASSLLKVIGYVYLKNNKFNESESYLNMALQKIAHLDPETRKESESSIYAYLGLLYSVTYISGEKANLGLQYALKGLDIINGNELFHKTNNTNKKLSFRVVENKVNLGAIYARLGKYVDSYNLYLKDADFIMSSSLDMSPHTISKISNKIYSAEFFLRTNNLEKADDLLNETKNEIENKIGKNSEFNLIVHVLKAETKIRSDKLNEAMNDCLSAFKEDNASKTNYLRLLSATAYYHAAVIHKKMNNYEKSWEYFKVFFEKINILSKILLSKEKYSLLLKKNCFFLPPYINLPAPAIINECFEKSTLIFSSIYGDDHPFVKEYVLHNDKYYYSTPSIN